MSTSDEIQLTQLLLEAFKQNPPSFKKKDQLKKLLSKSIRPLLHTSPGYMLNMLKDSARSEFYENLIKKNVSNKNVLEIGAGAGLLSVLCERHDAKTITSYEANEELFHIATENLVKNQCKKAKIRQGLSYDIDFKEEGQYDLVLHELFSNSALGEHVLPVLLDAKRFLAPGGKILPGQFNCWLLPVNSSSLRERRFIESERGVNLSALNMLYEDRFHPVNKEGLKLLRPTSEAKEAFSFDLNTDLKLSQSIEMSAEELGGADAVLYYFIVEAEDEKLSGYPHTGAKVATHWSPLLWFLKRPKQIKELTLSHNYFQIFIKENY